MASIPKLIHRTGGERDDRIKADIAVHLRDMSIQHDGAGPAAPESLDIVTSLATEVKLMPRAIFLTLCTLLFACVTAFGVAASILIR